MQVCGAVSFLWKTGGESCKNARSGFCSFRKVNNQSLEDRRQECVVHAFGERLTVVCFVPKTEYPLIIRADEMSWPREFWKPKKIPSVRCTNSKSPNRRRCAVGTRVARVQRKYIHTYIYMIYDHVCMTHVPVGTSLLSSPPRLHRQHFEILKKLEENDVVVLTEGYQCIIVNPAIHG